MAGLITFEYGEYFCTECGETFYELTEDGCCPYCDTEYEEDDSSL